MRTPDRAHDLAEELIGGMMPRWHLPSRAGRTAEWLADVSRRVPEPVVVAAWLHDVGYAPELTAAGFTRWTVRGSWSGVVSLRRLSLWSLITPERALRLRRGLLDEWQQLPVPDRKSLDILTMIDLSVGPTGDRVLERDRVAEILSRYGEDDPLHRAVSRSADELIMSSLRAKQLLGLSDEWPMVSVEGVLESEAHGRV